MENSKISPSKSTSHGQEVSVNSKTSITCTNVPDVLFDASTARKHFSKFGKVLRIRLFPKKHMCIVEYEQPTSVGKAILNAGAFDGFMFDVTRAKPLIRKISKKEDDPEWLPDSDVEEELSAMGGAPTYRITRHKKMEVETQSETTVKPKVNIAKFGARIGKLSPMRKNRAPREKSPAGVQNFLNPVPVIAALPTTLSTSEAAIELTQLHSRISLTPDEQWRTLDARDRILRSWGGAGSRVKVGGATIGTCSDMCPEKERLHRQAEHQVMSLESEEGREGELDPWRAVKQYSRSSADQEVPMCYELRPAPTLTQTCFYLLHELADTQRQVSLADWFHFMWDRLRGIRKDITQQALCCAESIRLVEMCARFHAHCAARLADLDHTQFDQKLNTDNITKCLQTLKHMYADVQPLDKPRESEFRGYIALLNLGDANFWWEIKQLPIEIQKSEPITFAIKVFNALDNNNYVRFFRLVREKATYLQACILLRYFNDVRARALARIVKAFAPRGGSRYPAEHFMKSLAFETIESMQYFIEHYGLRFSKTDDVEFSIILDRNSFIEDSEPYPISRALNVIESKRNSSVAEVIAGGPVPRVDYKNHTVYSSFSKDGRLKKCALVAEDQGYNTLNDSNKDVDSLKAEVQRLLQGRKVNRLVEEPKSNVFVKPQNKVLDTVFKDSAPEINTANESTFKFEPATVVSPNKVTYPSIGKDELDKSISFTFSEPEECTDTSFINDENNGFKPPLSEILLNAKLDSKGRNIFMRPNENKHFSQSGNLFSGTKPSDNIFKAAVLSQPNTEKHDNKNLFSGVTDENIFSKSESVFASKNVFSKTKGDNLFAKSVDSGGNIFANALSKQKENTNTNIFATANKTNIFSKSDDYEPKPIFMPNGDNVSDKVTPESIFKSACKPLNGPETKSYSIYKSKNKSLDNILSATNAQSVPVYNFACNNQNVEPHNQTNMQRFIEEKQKEEERNRKEELREKEERKLELKRQEEKQRKEEERKQQEEERRQEELRIKFEKEKAQSKRKAEEEERKFKAWVEKESDDVTDKLIDEINKENVEQLVREEIDCFNKLMEEANQLTNDILAEVCDEIIFLETQVEQFLTHKLMKKWFSIWRNKFLTGSKKRRLLDDTPVWIPKRTPMEMASILRRPVENSALSYMNAFHRGYKFEGELRLPTYPEPYNVMEIIKSALLKRMKEIKYPYDKCLFWKITLVTSGIKKWLYRKIELDKWLLNAFSDKKQHNVSNNLIRLERQSWNNLVDFAISVGLARENCLQNCTEALEGTNGLLFYATEDDNNFLKTIEETIRHKYMYQVMPVAILMPKILESTLRNDLETLLGCYRNNKVISEYKIFILERENLENSLDMNSKRALKWIARRYPHSPPLEIDYLKSICQRYLGNEIWHRLKSETDGRIKAALKDISKLIKLYNTAVDKLTDAITDEDVFNYPTFPLEFKCYLDDTSPYPKPYEFIPSNVKILDNVYRIKDEMKKLKLPKPMEEFKPTNVMDIQENMRSYCKQIGWFENPEEVLCRVVSVIPQELSNETMSREEFGSYLEQYDLHQLLNVIVYEKISSLKNFNNCYAIYDKSILEDFRSFNWLFDTDVVLHMKHKILNDTDDLDMFIEAKRRRIAFNSTEYLPLQDKDCTLVDEKIKDVDKCISVYSDCTNVVKKIEQDMEEHRKRSMEFERALKAALADV